jgi:predicted neuraminidase
LIEGTIVALDNGDLLQLFRTEVGFIYTARSSDNGATWSQPLRTRLPSNNSKLHALVLSNGALVLAYNNHESRANTDGVRSYLTVALSRDRGVTWRMLASLETSTKPGHRFHYPTMLQVGCRLLVAYTVSFKQLPWPGPKGMHSGIRLASIALDFSD